MTIYFFLRILTNVYTWAFYLYFINIDIHMNVRHIDNLQNYMFSKKLKIKLLIQENNINKYLITVK